MPRLAAVGGSGVLRRSRLRACAPPVLPSPVPIPAIADRLPANAAPPSRLPAAVESDLPTVPVGAVTRAT